MTLNLKAREEGKTQQMIDENLDKLIKIYFDTQCELADVLNNLSKHVESNYKMCEKTLNNIKTNLKKINAKLQ